MSDNANRDRYLDRVMIVVLVVLAGLYVALPNGRPDLTRFNCDDSEAYIGLANAIATGRGYTRCLNPEQDLPHKTWPPGLPLLIAPAIAVFGLNLVAMKLVVCAVGIAGLAFFYLLIRDVSDRRLAAWAAIAVGCSAHYVWFSHQVMAEVPMFAFSAAGLWMIRRAAAARDGWGWWIGAGLIVGFGGLVKGLVLLVAPAALVAVIRQTPERRRSVGLRYIAFFAIAVAPTVGWVVRNSQVETKSLDAINQFRMLLQQQPNDPNSPLITPASVARQVYVNVAWGLIYHVPNQVVPLVRLADLRRRDGGPLAALVLTLLIGAAVVASLRGGLRSVHALAGMLLALLTLFATGGTARYFVPVAPWFVLLGAMGVRRTRWWPRTGRAGTIVAVAWLAASGVDLDVALYQQETEPYADEQWGHFVAIAREAPKRIPPDGTVLVHNANAFTVISGLRTWITQPGVPFDTMAALRDGRITHLVVSKGNRPRDTGRRTWARENAEVLRKLGENEGYIVYAYAGPTRP